MLPVLLIAILSFANCVDTNTPNNTISSTEMANLLTTNLELFYLNDQAKKCINTKDPKSFTDCEPAITDPKATCCRIYIPGSSSMCFPVNNKYPAFFKYSFTKDGYTIDCPLVNNYRGTYEDVLIKGRYSIKPEDAQIIFKNTSAIDDELAAKCSAIKSPNSYKSCASAIHSTRGRCCYVSGDNGNTRVNICNAIPNASFKVMSNFYSQANAKIDCGSDLLENN
jgi:hypothetical protein